MLLSQRYTAIPQNKSYAKISKLGTSSNFQSKSGLKRTGFKLLSNPNFTFLGKVNIFRCFPQVRFIIILFVLPRVKMSSVKNLNELIVPLFFVDSFVDSQIC